MRQSDAFADVMPPDISIRHALPPMLPLRLLAYAADASHISLRRHATYAPYADAAVRYYFRHAAIIFRDAAAIILLMLRRYMPRIRQRAASFRFRYVCFSLHA